MLDNDNRIPLLQQKIENVNKSLYILAMEPGGGLIQEIEGHSFACMGKLGCELRGDQACMYEMSWE